MNRHLAEHGIKVREGTIVDATVIHAPTSTKNEAKGRDPEMGSTKKGNQWHFGAKVHVGVDAETKVIHSVAVTPANVHDSQALPGLLHGKETRVYGDKAYVGQKEVIRERSPRARDYIERKASRGRPLSDREKEKNRRKSRIRSRVEHVFGVMKHVFGWRKTRFRGLFKNLQYALGVASAVNIYLHRWAILRSMTLPGAG
ncbi:IS5 family transposase [Thermopirellula anaerolimosa]